MPNLATLAAVALLCIVCFAVGKHIGYADAGSPCVYSYDADGRTLCVMTEEAAAREKE